MTSQQESSVVEPAGFFALRTPLLSVDELTAWSEGLDAPRLALDSTQLEEALVADRLKLRGRLRDIVTRPEVREALFVASPDLEERLDVWLRDPQGEAGQKMERALVRYIARMAGRPTPFGLCAGCSVGTLGSRTRLLLKGKDHYRRHSRLDMDYVVALTGALTQQPELRRNLLFRPNTSIYRANSSIRYAECRRDGKGWSHHRITIERSDYLDATLRHAALGACPGDLAAALVEADPEASLEEAQEYIDELIKSQVLLSELTPAITGPEPLQPLMTRLHDQGVAAVANRLNETRIQLENLDAAPLGIEPERYRSLARQLESLPAKVELPRLFQVDMVKPMTEATLGPEVLEEIGRGVEILRRLFRGSPRDNLARFREAFTARYEQREVPLAEALDEELGVGFDAVEGHGLDASALLDGLAFPSPKESSVSWGRRESILLARLSEVLGRGADEIVLSPKDMDELAEAESPPLPESFSVMASVAARSQAALADGDFRILLENGSGPSGARLFGRFCHGDPELHRHVARYLQAEEAQHPDVIYAEIVHQSEGRLGNVTVRPALHAYEIPYLGQAGVASDFQIPITDLRVSVVGEEIVLRSARLGKRVFPRLTNAHNFANGQGIYRFLCQLQMQGVAGWFFWDWGPLKDAPFLPRIVCGRLVLARARWRLTQEELHSLGKAQGTARWLAVQAWRVERRLPRLVCLAEADNELPIDLDNVLSVETFVELAKNQQQAALVELFPGPEEWLVRGPEGRFVHELVVPFLHNTRQKTEQDESKASSASTIRHSALPRLVRSFPPGSEWLYAKIYTGPAMADQVLQQVVGPVIKEALESGAADQWFFIRYGDPDWHLRLRLHGSPDALFQQTWPALREAVAPLMEEGRVWKLQLDTYEREVERYGGTEGILLAERLFQADSEAVLTLLAACPEDARSDWRWRLAVEGIDLLLDDLGFDLMAKAGIVTEMRTSFAREFRVDANLKHQLGDKFRKERQNLESLLGASLNRDDSLSSARAVFRQRAQQFLPVTAELQALDRAGRLSSPLKVIAASFVHMHVNRLLRSAHRAHEAVLYNFLGRVYDSRLARLREKETPPPESGLACLFQAGGMKNDDS